MIEIPIEVVAEIVYVLEGVYKVKRKEIKTSLLSLLSQSNIVVYNSELLKFALDQFVKTSLDFVDTLLLAYKTVENKKVYTFDKKLLKALNQ